MSKLFTAKDIKLMGEPHETYGQTYWGNVHEQAEPVRFNLKEQIDFFPGRMFSAEEWANKTASSGNEYTQLKKVSLVEKGESEKPRATPSTVKTVSPVSSGDSYEPGTNARWAIKLSIDTFKSVLGRIPEEGTDYSMLHDFAEWLLDEFQRLKAYSSGTQVTKGDHLPSSEASKSEGSEPSAAEPEAESGPGYDKFLEARQELSTSDANDFLQSLDEDELVD